MVATVMQQQQTSAVASQPTNPQSSLRSPPPPPAATATPTQSPHALAPHRDQQLDHALVPIGDAHRSGEPAALMACPLARVRLSDIAPYEGAPGGTYGRAVEALAGSLMRHNAALIELGSGDAALMRCGLEAARLYFRSRAQQSVVGKGSRGVYTYRAGRYLIYFFSFCFV
jgi:hypothetical protein